MRCMYKLKQAYFRFCHRFWRKTSLYLPLWRQETQRRADTIQAALDSQHSKRDSIDEVLNENMTSYQTVLWEFSSDTKKHPLIYNRNVIN